MLYADSNRLFPDFQPKLNNAIQLKRYLDIISFGEINEVVLCLKHINIYPYIINICISNLFVKDYSFESFLKINNLSVISHGFKYPIKKLVNSSFVK